MNIRMIALDMDGTTLNNDHITLPERNRHAILAAIAKQIHVVTATGRMRHRLPAVIEAMPGTRYAVTSNGAAVWDLAENRLLYENPLAAQTVLEIIRLLEPLGAYLELYHEGCCYALRSREDVWYSFPFPDARRNMMLHRRYLVDDLAAFVLDGEKKIEKINIPYLPEEIRPAVWAQLQALQSVIVTSSLPGNAEINAVGANKADGLSQLCRHLGILPEQVLAVGDGQNDLEMLAFAGFSAVPANGLDACKKIADLVVGDNESGAVADAIAHWIE